MNGTTNTFVITACNHASKNMRSVLDVDILWLTDAAPYLYQVSDYASGVLVLKLHTSDKLNNLLSLITNSNKDPLNVGIMAMSLYFLRSFICIHDCVVGREGGQSCLCFSVYCDLYVRIKITRRVQLSLMIYFTVRKMKLFLVFIFHVWELIMYVATV